MEFDKCTVRVSHKKIKVEENRCSATVDNESGVEIKKVKIDGCLITGHEERCDWMFLHEEPEKHAHLIELKGKKIDKAVSQLKSTLGKLSRDLEGYKKTCYAITTTYPKHGPSTLQRKKEFKDQTKALLEIKNIKFTIKV
ncbi:hypothetical protein [Chromohalobacter israelensis]|uniref:hypothetical protein n=1 Tax=Chromohalobacter israelensis TaxID=141390 RepID=UPI000FFEA803|nr:hypothetical protein [Chromohalobacter salexigens]